jgi:hypothetical protein
MECWFHCRSIPHVVPLLFFFVMVVMATLALPLSFPQQEVLALAL